MGRGDPEWEGRVAQLEAEEAELPLRLWYMSFADGSLPEGSQWLGACFVKARGLVDATKASHRRGCNPGGGVKAGAMEDGTEIPDEWLNRLLNKDDFSRFDREVFGGDGNVVQWSDAAENAEDGNTGTDAEEG